MDKMFSPATLTPQRMKKGVEKEMTENRKRPQERFCHSNYVVLVLLYQKKESSSMKTQREANTVVWFSVAGSNVACGFHYLVIYTVRRVW